MRLVACARMYNVTPAARRAWTALFAWLSETSGVDLRVIDHPAPAPLDQLWRRPDMGCVFMCGWPFSRAVPRPRPIAAPVPSAGRHGGRPVYATDLIVRRDSGYRRLEDTFGGRIAWTVDSSHSGFNAPRHHLLAFRTAGRPRLYRESIGPLVTPARALASVLDGTADVAPMDSYALDLIRRHEPDRVAGIAVIATTSTAPIPPLVAAHDLDAATGAKLRGALLGAGDDPGIAPVLADLALSGFAAVTADDYDLAESWARDALAAGYPRPE